MFMYQSVRFTSFYTRFSSSPIHTHTHTGRCLAMAAMEQTFIMAKPDAVQRGIVSDIVSRFEKRGYKLVALKLMKPPKSLLEEHYKDLASKPFFPKLMEYMTSGPVVAMVWEGKDVVATGRKMLGATNPLESNPGTIRGDFSIEVSLCVCFFVGMCVFCESGGEGGGDGRDGRKIEQFILCMSMVIVGVLATLLSHILRLHI